MANHLYSYTPSYGASSLSTPFSSLITGTSLTDPHLSDTPSLFSRYLTSDPTPLTDHSKYSVLDKGSLFSNDSLRLSSGEIVGIGAGALSAGAGIGATTPWTSMSQMPLTSVEPRSVLHSSVVDPVVAGIKRPVEALYHQNIVGTHTSIGQSDVMFSSNPLAKLPRIENASNLPIYPQRPGEKDCTHYMMTRICKFGDACKFDHPLWVPEGGIPDWKEVPLASVLEFLPERPGEPNCPYYLKTLKCKFGFKCKFNHPRDVEALKASLTAEGNSEAADIVLPERPNEPLCSLYAKTGKCKYGIHCKFNHPKDLEIPTDQTGTDKPPIPFTPALLHNSKGLPIRPGEVDCPFYLKTGSCKYSVTCRFNHPDRTAINPPVAAGLGHSIINSPAINPPFGVVNPTVAVLPHASLDPRLAQNALALGPTVYPQRPGNLECDHYMKTGRCDFGQRCKFHHPINRPAVAPAPSLVNQALQPNVKLTLAGLPRREGLPTCAFYMKTGMCKFGVTCRFDHPPPGEVIALVASQGASVAEETS